LKKQTEELLLVALVFIALAVCRVIHMHLTGYLLPDEALYYYSTHEYFRTGRYTVHFIDRLPYQAFVHGVCVMLNLRSAQSYITVFTSLSAFFLILTLSFMRDANPDLSPLLFLLCPVVLLLAPLSLSENFALLNAVFGIYMLIEGDPVPAAVSLGLASLMREPYAILLIGNIPYLLYKDKQKGLIFTVCTIPFLLTLLLFNPHFSKLLPVQVAVAPPVKAEPVAIYAKPETSPLTTPLPPVERLAYTILNTLISFTLGFGLTFYLALSSIFRTLRKHRVDVVTFNAALCLLSVAFAIAYQTRTGFYATPLCLLTVIRLSHTGLPALLVVGKVKRKILLAQKKKILIAQLPILLLLGFFALTTRYATLTPAPWLRMARLCENTGGRVLIYGEPIRRLALFVPENVVVKVPHEKEEFMSLIPAQWRKIYLYGELHPLHWQALRDNCPWYYRLVHNTLIGNSTCLPDGCEVKVVWFDESSYCLEVKRNGR